MKPEHERALQEFCDRAKREMFPKMEASLVALSVITTGSLDAKLAIELGAALLYDKPLIVLIQKGVKVSPRLRQVADAYIEFDDFHDPHVRAELNAALAGLPRKGKASREN